MSVIRSIACALAIAVPFSAEAARITFDDLTTQVAACFSASRCDDSQRTFSYFESGFRVDFDSIDLLFAEVFLDAGRDFTFQMASNESGTVPTHNKFTVWSLDGRPMNLVRFVFQETSFGRSPYDNLLVNSTYRFSDDLVELTSSSLGGAFSGMAAFSAELIFPSSPGWPSPCSTQNWCTAGDVLHLELVPVPLPATAWLVGMAALGLGAPRLLARRRQPAA